MDAIRNGVRGPSAALLLSGAMLLASPGLSAAQGAPAAQLRQPSTSLYAVNAAAISAAMTYCATKYQNLNQGSPGAACYQAARGVLAGMKLRDWADGIDRECSDPATYNRCITPQVGRLVYALQDAFVAAGL